MHLIPKILNIPFTEFVPSVAKEVPGKVSAHNFSTNASNNLEASMQFTSFITYIYIFIRTNLVAVLVPDTGLRVDGHVEVTVEEPDLLCAGQGAQEAVPFTGHLTGLVLTPAKLPLLLSALSDGVTVGHTLQVGIYPDYEKEDSY